MRSIRLAVLICCVGGLLGSPFVTEAATYKEINTAYNAHDLPSNAELLSYVSTNATALTTLNGTLGSSAGGLGEGDLYEIYISNPSAFSASTPVGGPNVNGFNTQLFLFNTNGTGIEANDDAPSGIGTASQLTALTGFGNYSAGYYYLLITGESLNPAVSTNGAAIFPNDGSRTITTPTSANALFAGYTDNSNEFGQYSITLTGVQISPVPEPSSIALVVLAAGMAGFTVRRRRQRAVAVLAAVCLLTAAGRAADLRDPETLRKQHLLAADGIPKNLGLGLGDLARDHQAMQREEETRRLSGRPMTEAETQDKFNAVTSKYSLVQTDKKNRVLVNVYLDGVKPVKKMANKLTNKGLKVIAKLDTYRKGVISAWMPVALAAKVATINGVRAVQLAPRPYFRAVHPVGQVTSQGQTVLHADAVLDLGYDGTGIKIGALSDTFNLYPAAMAPNSVVPDVAAYDVAEGDLPVVQDIADYDIGVPTDEGRGMLQIAHDIAPGASLAFATAEGTETVFAQNITILGSPATVTGLPMTNLSTGAITSAPGVGCQIVCDDVGYFDEPMFSDGIVAQAIDYIATTYNVSYFSSAGNDGNSGYSADYVNAVTATRTLANVKTIAAAEGVNLDQTTASGTGGTTVAVTPSLYSGGIQTFGTDSSGNPIVVQNVTVGSIAANISFQWDDPYDQSVSTTVGTGTDPIGITTDYNILVFDASGVYQSSMSGTGDNFQTNQPIELPGTSLTAGTSYKIMITRATDTDDPAVTAGGTPANPPVSTHLRYVAASDGGGFSGDFIGLNSVETYGHNCAANCSGVAAYVYDAIPNITKDPNHVATPQVESFSSNGPVQIYFDTQGNRLKTPNLRLQPAFATVDGVDTSFFPAVPGVVIVPGGILPISPPTLPTLPIDLPVSPTITTTNPEDYDGNGYSNFFGTSAAAPHAAACAALIMQAASANNLATPNPKYIRTLLQATTQQTGSSPGTDTQPDYCAATGTTSGYTVTLAGSGDVSTDPNTFRITYTGPAGSGYKLTSMFIDLTHSELVFDSDPTTGYPFTQGDTGTAETGGATLAAAVESDPANPTTTATNHLPAATLTFTNFAVGDQLTFGVDRDVQGINAYGNGVDQLEGSTFTATLTSLGSPNITVTGTFTNQFSTAYNFKAGYGLVDVHAAVLRMLGR